jgi:hypothetical protein
MPVDNGGAAGAGISSNGIGTLNTLGANHSQQVFHRGFRVGGLCFKDHGKVIGSGDRNQVDILGCV